MLKGLIYFVTGVAVGSALTYALTRKERKEYVDACQEELDRLTEWKHQRILADRNEELKANLNLGAKRTDLTYTIEPSEPKTEEDFTEGCSETNYTSEHLSRRDRMEEKYNSKKAMMDQYEELMADEPDEDEEEEEDEDYTGYIPTYPKEGPSETPYSITPEQFEGDNHLDKEFLVWWPDDGVLATEEEEDVTDEMMNTVGYDFDEYFDMYYQGYAYVRNDMNGTDYEIYRQRGRFVPAGAM